MSDLIIENIITIERKLLLIRDKKWINLIKN